MHADRSSAPRSSLNNLPLEKRIAQFLKPKVRGAKQLEVANLKQKTEGFSYRTFTFTAKWNDNGKRRIAEMVIRMEPEDTIAIGPCNIQSQFLLLSALRKTDVPVPKVLWFEKDPEVLGRPFYVMEKVDGEVPIPWGSGDQGDKIRDLMAEKFVEMLGRIHRVVWESLRLGFLLGSNLGETVDPAEREIKRWRKVVFDLSIRQEPILMEALLWLERNKPKPSRLCLVHGDYRLGNFIWKDSNIQAILDWEIAGIGDPMCDIGWLCLRCWREETPTLMTGLIERERLYSLYEKYSGEKIDRDRVLFWEVLGNVHMAAILIQIMRGFQDKRIKDLRLIPMEDFLYRPILKELINLLRF